MKPLATFTVILILLSMAGAHGQTAGSKYETVAENFLSERLQLQGNKWSERNHVTFSHSIDSETGPMIYAYNVLPEGWVMVSAYENSIPVLAYSFEGKLIKDGFIPPAAQMWIDEFVRQVTYNQENDIGADRRITGLWKRYSDSENLARPVRARDIAPLLTSNWDQGKHYNELCPLDPAGPGGRCYAGCVATAMGQIMSYFQWPHTGVGSYSYTWPPYGTISANFGNSVYEWHLMEPSISHSNPEVAEILHHLGVSVDMEYGPNGSGMTNHKAAYSMRTYFKYSQETEYVFRDSTTLDWDSLIISHLDRKIPLYYAGWSVPNINGHAFVCDGYQDSLYYHFNWGWSGTYNGYFYTSSLNPGGANFNLAQELIINAAPDTALYNYPGYCQDTVVYETLGGTLEDGSGPLYDYQDNSSCHWQIMPDDSIEGITLEFLRFDVHPGDSVIIYDGPDSSAPVLDAFSGNELPGAVTTPGNTMFVQFITDNDTAAPGWQAFYSCELPVYCQNMTQLTAQADTFSDGSNNYNYHNNTACLWMIDPPDADIVTLNFISFATEDTMDFLEIYDLETQELLASYSGDYSGGLPEPVTSESGKMFVAFYTNYNVTDSGWEAWYETDLVGQQELPGKPTVRIFPNPTVGSITVSLPGITDPGLLSLYNISGKEVLQFELDGKENTLSLEGLEPGLYVCRIFYGQEIVTRKVIRY